MEGRRTKVSIFTGFFVRNNSRLIIHLIIACDLEPRPFWLLVSGMAAKKGRRVMYGPLLCP